LQLSENGHLAGLSFAVKDLIDVAGYRTACGNPDRLRYGEDAVATAPSVLIPLMAGARLVGKTHTDELACGMFGLNPHFGTPINPRATDRTPGGSSSGSASAVAAGLCDFALGTDTGGSIRVPSSFCGLFGIRTTFGRISVAGVMAMAPSFDTVGWLARSATMLTRVGEAYFGSIRTADPPRLMLAADAFQIPVPRVRQPLLRVAESLKPIEVTLFAEGFDYWRDTFRPLQLYDLWSTLGAWATKPGRTLSQAVAERIELSANVDPSNLAEAASRRELLTERMVRLLGDDGILIIPTAHDLPPHCDATVREQAEFRDKTLMLTCVASLCRLPQVNIPVATVEGCPVGLSLIAGPRGDERLLAACQMLSALGLTA
jgi:amidase